MVFGRSANAFVADTHWLRRRLLTHDQLSHRQALEFFAHGISRERDQVDLFESVERAVRKNMKRPPTLAHVSRQLHLSERTLRRRLCDSALSYQALLEEPTPSPALVVTSLASYFWARIAHGQKKLPRRSSRDLKLRS